MAEPSLPTSLLLLLILAAAFSGSKVAFFSLKSLMTEWQSPKAIPQKFPLAKHVAWKLTTTKNSYGCCKEMDREYGCSIFDNDYLDVHRSRHLCVCVCDIIKKKHEIQILHL